MIPIGYVEDSNKFSKSFHPKKPTSYIKYFDTNTLHRHSMMQLLPNEILDWVNPEKFNWDNYSDHVPIGCSLEVELDYPGKLDDLHDYFLAAEKIKEPKDILYQYQLQIIEKDKFSLGKNKNLIPNLGNKTIETPL